MEILWKITGNFPNFSKAKYVTGSMFSMEITGNFLENL